MSDTFARAYLVALSDGDAPKEIDRVDLDFNPETLQIRVSASATSNAATGGAEQSANGKSTASLSFDAVFDNTRPRDTPPTAGGASVFGGASLSLGASASAGGLVSVSAGASASFSASASASVGASASIALGASAGAGPGSDDELDVRRRTGKIASWVTGSTDVTAPRPAHIEFHWGRLIWRGVIDSFSETVDYFSPAGIPLRSKVSISITEARLENREDAEERKSLALSQGFAAGASASLDFSASAGFGLSAGASLGAGVDLGFSASAGVSMSADLALGVFGGGAVSAAMGGGVDLSASASAATGASRSAPNAPTTPTAWAPTGPAALTAASATASLVIATRVSGAAAALPDPGADSFRATSLQAPPTPIGTTTASRISAQIQTAGVAAPVAPAAPLPIVGAPPRNYPTAREPAAVASAHRTPPQVANTRGPRRPRWERLSPVDVTSGAAHAVRCGCARCGGAA